jgi:hypothetical protein
MANSPNTKFDWALDNLFDSSFGPSGSAWHNEPNKILPVPLRVSQGYVPSQSLDAESLNYLFNSLGQWSLFFSQSIDEFNKAALTERFSNISVGRNVEEAIPGTCFAQAWGSGSAGFARVAVGTGAFPSRAYVSGSGVEFWHKTTGGSDEAFGIVYGAGAQRWVSAGKGNEIRYSLNGTTWVTQASPISGSVDMRTVDYSSDLNQFLMLGGDDGKVWAVSGSATGNNWSLLSPAPTEPIRSLRWGGPIGDRRWIVVGDGFVYTSTDGLAWSNVSANLPGGWGNRRISDVCWDEIHQVWIAACNNRRFIVNDDPVSNSWTAVLPFEGILSDQRIRSIDSYNGLTVAVTDNDISSPFEGNIITWSTDGGQTWSYHYTALPINGTDGFTQVRWDNFIKRWIFCGLRRTGNATAGFVAYTPSWEPK